MQAIADIVLICGALGVAFYCFVLSRRLSRFNNLEHGVGGAVAVLSAQVDDLTRALKKARQAAETSGSSLSELTDRADSVARRMELHMAAMHDLDDRATPPRPAPAPAPEASGSDFVATDFTNAASVASGETARAAMAARQPTMPPPVAPDESPIPALVVPGSTDLFAMPPHAPEIPAPALSPQNPAVRGVRPVSSFFATTATPEIAL